MRKTRITVISSVMLSVFISVWISGEKSAGGQKQTPPIYSVLSDKLAR